MIISIRVLFSFVLTGLLICCAPPVYDLSQNVPENCKEEYAVSYFREIGFGSEFEENNRKIIRKWRSGVRVKLHGSYTAQDLAEVRRVVSELSSLTKLSVDIVEQNPNINIYFVTPDVCKRYIPNFPVYNPQDGYFSISNLGGADFSIILGADICIKSTITNFQHRNHLIREELTQSFGLMKDSYTCPSSVFQQDPQYKPTEYSSIDRAVIRLLYDNRVRPGMMEAQFLSAIGETATTIALAP